MGLGQGVRRAIGGRVAPTSGVNSLCCPRTCHRQYSTIAYWAQHEADVGAIRRSGGGRHQTDTVEQPHRLGSIRSAKWPSRSRHRTACGGSQLPGTSAILVGLRTWPLGPDGRAGAPLTTPIPRRNTQREDAEDRMSCLSLGYLRGDPGHHTVVVVGDVVLCDVVRSGVPDAVVAQDISQCLVEILCRVRAPDVVRMQ